MNGGQHRFLRGRPLPTSEAMQQLHHVERHGAVEATGGFIGKEQGGLREQLGGEGQATPLTA